MHEHERLSRPRLGHVHAQSAGLYEGMLHSGHIGLWALHN
jgi:hypothetical protein